MTVEAIAGPVLAPAAVVCRNMTRGVLVIASDPRRTHEVNFGAYDTSDGSDYQHMPPEIIRTPAFAKQIAIGTLVVIEGGEDPVADNDYVTIQCIGPGTRADAVCGENIPRKATEVMVTPPLCDRHQGLKDRCMRRGDGPWLLEPAR